MPLPEASAIRVPMPPPGWDGTESVTTDPSDAIEVRCWQPDALSGMDYGALEVLDGVMRNVVPGLLLQSREQVEAAAAAPDPQAMETYQTVVELRARVRALSERAVLEAFDRTVEALQQLDRATRVLARSQGAPLTRERLHPLVPFATLGDDQTWDRRTGWVIAHRGVPYETASDKRELPSATYMEKLRVQMDYLRRGDPMSLYWDRLLPAYAAYDNGDFDTATLNSAIATETLIDSVLALAYWEDSRAPAEAALVLAKGIVRKVRTELPRTLGANPSPWSLDVKDSVVGRWRADLVDLRNAIVHRGYVATREHAIAAVQAAEDLQQILTDAVLATTHKRPRGALMLLGPQAIKDAGHWDTSVEEVSRFDWLDIFNSWRDEVDASYARKPSRA